MADRLAGVRAGAVTIARRMAVGLVAGLWSACSCSEGPRTPSPAPSGPTSVPAPVPPSTAPPATEPADDPARTPSADVVREVSRLVRDARRAEHDGDHAAALASFDAALRLVPGQPRVACEAGFVAHRAGRDAVARERIETALRLFGPPRAIQPEARAPLAMCLYNAGLVEEAAGDPRRAAEHFAASLELREHATVRTALDRVRGAGSAAEPGDAGPNDSVGGVAVDADGTLLASTEANLFDALRAGLSGFDEFSATRSEPESTRIEVRARPPSGSEAVVLEVHSDDYPLSTERVVVALRTANGYALAGFESGGHDRTDHGTWGGSSLTSLEASWIGTVLRLDVEIEGGCGSMTEIESEGDGTCWATESSHFSETRLVLCPTEPWLRCSSITTRSVEGESAREVICDETANAVDDESSTAGPPAESSAVVRVEPDGIVVERLDGASAADALGLEARRYDWAELDSNGRFTSELSLLTDAERAAEAEGSDE